jgi:hypothetical protein
MAIYIYQHQHYCLLLFMFTVDKKSLLSQCQLHFLVVYMYILNTGTGDWVICPERNTTTNSRSLNWHYTQFNLMWRYFQCQIIYKISINITFEWHLPPRSYQCEGDGIQSWWWYQCPHYWTKKKLKTKLHGLSPWANYTDRANTIELISLKFIKDNQACLLHPLTHHLTADSTPSISLHNLELALTCMSPTNQLHGFSLILDWCILLRYIVRNK